MKTLQAKFTGAALMLTVTGITFAEDTHHQPSASPTATSQYPQMGDNP